MSVDLKLVKELRDRTNLGMNDCKKALEESNSNIEAAIDLLKKWGELKGKERASKVATEGKVGGFANNGASVVGIFEVNCQTDFVSNSPAFCELMDPFDKMNGFNEDKFEAKRKELSAQTGENIVLRRKEVWTTSHNSAIRWYHHPGDKLEVLVEVSAPIMTLAAMDFADECAMQVAAMAPLVVSKDDIPADMLVRQRRIFEAQLEEEKKPAASWQKIIEGKFIKWRKDIVLLEQESIKDSKKTIEQMRQEAGKDVQILRFVRYALGEGLERKQEDLANEVEKLINNQ